MDIIIQIAVLHIAVGPPYLCEQQSTGEGLAGTAQKNFQKASLPFGHTAGAGYAGQRIFLRPVHDIPEGKLPRQFHSAGAAGDTPDSCHQFFKGKGFYQIIVSAQIEPGYLVVEGAKGGD